MSAALRLITSGVLAILLAVATLVATPTSASAAINQLVVIEPRTMKGAPLTGMWIDVRDDAGTLVASQATTALRLRGGKTFSVTVTDFSGTRVTTTRQFTVEDTGTFDTRQVVPVRMLRAARVQAVVKHQDGTGTSTAEGVTATAVGDAGTFRATTGSNGRFRLGSLPPGTYVVTISDPSGTYAPSAPQTVTLKATNLRDLGTIVLSAA